MQCGCFVFCSRQVVLEKGLGQNGMTLTSLKEEGFQVVFVGIGQSPSSFTYFVHVFFLYLNKTVTCLLTSCADKLISPCIKQNQCSPPLEVTL